MKARLDKRLTTVPAGWRVAAGDFLARLDIAREMGMFEPKPPHIMSTFRRRFSDPPVLYVVTKTAPGSTLRYLSLNPAALPFFIEQETLLKIAIISYFDDDRFSVDLGRFAGYDEQTRCYVLGEEWRL